MEKYVIGAQDTAMALATIIVGTLKRHGKVILIAANPEGEEVFHGVINNTQQFMETNQGPFREIVNKYGQFTNVDFNPEEGTVKLSYMEFGAVAKSEGATLQ